MEHNKPTTPVSYLFEDILNHLKPVLTVSDELILADMLKKAQIMEKTMNRITWVDSKLLSDKVDYDELIKSFDQYYEKKYKS